MRWSVRRYDEPGVFRQRAEPWLLRREAEHNLLLGILRTLDSSPHLYEPPIYLATVESDGEVAGCAFRTPPFKLGLTRLPLEAMPALVEDVAAVYASVPAVLGPMPQARRFGELWCERTGGEPRDGMRQRIFQLDRVRTPDDPAPGRLRPATETDLDLVVGWVEAFRDDASVALPNPRRLARERVEAEAVFLWEEEEPVSMAAYGGETPNGVRIGFVYTPPPLRRRGYATACVAALSQRALDAGRRFCFLYTDLSNPGSNRIYERIGYRPVCDVIDVRLADEGSESSPPSRRSAGGRAGPAGP